MSDVNTRQEGGTHYAGAYQHWDFVAEYLGNDYLLGCATKYIWRHAKKNGLEDLRKADHYLQKAAERPTQASRHFRGGLAQKLRGIMPPSEFALLVSICRASSISDIDRVREELRSLMLDNYRQEIRRAQAEDDGPFYDDPPGPE